MRQQVFRTCLAVVLVLAWAALAVAGDADVAVVREQVRRAILEEEGTTAAKDVEWMVRNLSAMGRWPDVDYQDVSAARWKPRAHMERLLAMAGAWAAPAGPFKGSPAVLDACRRALDFWLAKDFQSKNWWYNELSIPRRMGSVLLLLESQLDAEQRRKGLGIVGRGWAGLKHEAWEANLNQVDRASVRILQGCLEHNPHMLAEAFASVTFTLGQDPAEARKSGGIQPDLSFQMHGPQLYTGGYGLIYPATILEIARFARGTQWALTSAQLEHLTGYMLDHQRWVVRGPWLDPATLGRNISRPDADNAGLLDRALELLAGFNPPRLAEAAAFREEIKAPGRGGPAGNRYFWNSEYMVHRRPGVLATVRMVSTRTRGTESGNGENLKGEHLSQGSFFLLRRGDDYAGLFPAWDWRMVPGVTALQAPPPFAQYTWGRGSEGESDFAGGVSDGEHGAAAMDFRYKGLTARKSWMFFDDLAVLLGAGIGHAGGPVYSTMDQRRLTGPAASGAGPGGQPLPKDLTMAAPARWIWNGGVGWLSLEEAPLQVQAAVQEGDWQDINTSLESRRVREPVLSIWKDHGVSPRDHTYAVLVGLAHDEAAFRSLTGAPPVQVLANTPALQAASHPKKGLTAAVFYQPGSLTVRQGLTVTVEQPCLVLLREDAQTLAVSVANPRSAAMTASLRCSMPLTGEGATPDADGVRLEIPLPAAEQAGRTRTVVYRK
ncbi:polysaccharide lyase family 8 super-sandwich domain-containing protein [Megalodesulfovibrio gigas]|uniref:Putative polysaccharide lyase family 8 n=1 Tax=Megalodesulfovibrio gigas (strain ATCC 19364 / DSM 1382 / NCIMB 9332 / VKM B-1759) TaxID=1121448 RepID=T2GCG4_MEGG1|nr:polysaccharide lyase family 8 super-sandwich domain-containing protein [Megalodesulfovibrio gigas]AGW13874.1 putative polysaccharide lyase family 8 [Megalodesulfovibrio gigas DSM 1382 = ATCC 19364]